MRVGVGVTKTTNAHYLDMCGVKDGTIPGGWLCSGTCTRNTQRTPSMCTHARMHTHTRARIHARARAHTHTHTHTHTTHTDTHTQTAQNAHIRKPHKTHTYTEAGHLATLSLSMTSPEATVEQQVLTSPSPVMFYGQVTDVRACSGAQSAIHKKSQLYKVSGRVAERAGAFSMRVYVRVFLWVW
jgi:hypothetical protein